MNEGLLQRQVSRAKEPVRAAAGEARRSVAAWRTDPRRLRSTPSTKSAAGPAATGAVKAEVES
jgi:hypothetical protein